MASKRKHTPIRDPVFLDSRRLVIRYGGVNWNILKTVIFTVVFPGTVAVYIPYRLRGPDLPVTAGFGLLGWLPIAAGMAVYGWCAWDFATYGRGTPLPLDAPRKLVAHGLYRFVRNPMYAGVLLVICGQGLLFGSFAIVEYMVAVAVLFHSFVLLYEEPALGRKFGASYKRYRETVPRWVPGTGFRAGSSSGT